MFPQRGWGGGSGSKLLAGHTEDLVARSLKSLCWERETGGSLHFTGQQSSLICELQVKDRPCLEKMMATEEWHPRFTFGLHTHLREYTQIDTHTCKPKTTEIYGGKGPHAPPPLSFPFKGLIVQASLKLVCSQDDLEPLPPLPRPPPTVCVFSVFPVCFLRTNAMWHLG